MNTKDLITKMLKEKTSTSILDSGSVYGYNWQKNQNIDFEKKPEVEVWNDREVLYTISVYHYLIKQLEVDNLCEEFNKLECKEWNSGIY
jgi:hypothetical protein